ncbi:cytochrome c oxidase subunit II [Mesorhizobium sp. A623]
MGVSIGRATLPDVTRYPYVAPILSGMAFLSGCAGPQSSLVPGGAESEEVATLFWAMVAGGAVIWAVVVGGFVFASRRRSASIGEAAARRFIIWGGVVFPVVTLLLLLSYALWLMPGLRPFANAGEPALRIEVTGKQFWWKVVYHLPGGETVSSANEIRLPVGARVAFALNSDDVIHSFWIPALGGKMDMIPGRTNRLSLLATKTGTYRAPCAEYCGTSHALMAFAAVAMERGEFDAWIAGEAKPSAGATAGEEAFLRNGCGACHRVDGTEAQGTLGPDLSHLASRLTLGAGILPNTEETISRFIAAPDTIKPGSKMPAFGMLPEAEIAAIAAYLKGLQ